MELKILKYITEKDTNDISNAIKVRDHFMFRQHLCLSFEILSMNLYEFLAHNNFQGISLGLIKRFAIQVLQCLHFLNEHQIIHCDMKPENILLRKPDKSGIRVIDFGSGCFANERIYTYIQSRFYRAPEIILGIPYTTAIDMWSFGCIIAELYRGYPIFPGEDEKELLALIMEIKGLPPSHVLLTGSRTKLFFDEHMMPTIQANSRGVRRKISSKSLTSVLNCDDELFIDLIDKCLNWDPKARIAPLEALTHEWILQGLPPKVLEIHKKQYAPKQVSMDIDDEQSKLKSKRMESGKRLKNIIGVGSRPRIVIQTSKNSFNVPNTTTNKEKQCINTMFTGKNISNEGDASPKTGGAHMIRQLKK